MRIRTVKPEFFLHDGLFDLEQETGLPIRVAFIGLWCAADREGRFKLEPRRLGAAILPYDQVDFSRVLHALTTRGFIVVYRVGDACFGCIPSWKRHQVINNRESASILPDVSQGVVLDHVDACSTRAPRVVHACPTPAKGKGREGKGIAERELSRAREGTQVAKSEAEASRDLTSRVRAAREADQAPIAAPSPDDWEALRRATGARPTDKDSLSTQSEQHPTSPPDDPNILTTPNPHPSPKNLAPSNLVAERPSLEETQAHAATIGLAPWKAADWWNEMEGCGWLDHLSRPVIRWKAILARVKTKWEADGRPSSPPAARQAAVTQVNGAQPQDSEGISKAQRLFLAKDELSRVDAAIKSIRGSYDDHQTISLSDHTKLKALKARKAELAQVLGYRAS